MDFQEVEMFQKNEKKYCGRKITTYDYEQPALVQRYKIAFFYCGLAVFIIALISYILDLIFSSGKSLFPYGFSIVSIVGILVTFFFPIELYRNKDNIMNYPLDKVSKIHARACPFRLFVMSFGILVVAVVRFVLALLVSKGEGKIPSSANVIVEWVQVGIYGVALVLSLFVVIAYSILNHKYFHKVEKPVELYGYVAKDLIREFQPFSWIFIVLLAIMMFFITLLIP